jgi:2'-5' RNA ligase
MDRRELYFIAIMPHGELSEDIRAVKARIQSAYGSGHALRSPAHITLQMPFKRSPEEERKISSVLRRFSAGEMSFTVDLDGFGAFPPRVIYIRIKDPEPVRSLHRKMAEVLLHDLGFSDEEVMKEVQPHITVATRDLTRTAFSEAWPEFRDGNFSGRFEVQSIFLLKHFGNHWEAIDEFPFGKK